MLRSSTLPNNERLLFFCCYNDHYGQSSLKSNKHLLNWICSSLLAAKFWMLGATNLLSDVVWRDVSCLFSYTYPQNSFSAFNFFCFRFVFVADAIRVFLYAQVWCVLSFLTYPDQASSASQCPPYTRRPFPQYPPLQNILPLKNIFILKNIPTSKYPSLEKYFYLENIPHFKISFSWKISFFL